MRYKRTNVLQLTNLVQQNVKNKQLFHSYNNLLIMFSGGQDSAFCVLVFHLLQNKRRLKLNSTILWQTQSSKKRFYFLQKQSFCITPDFFYYKNIEKKKIKNITFTERDCALLNQYVQKKKKTKFFLYNKDFYIYLLLTWSSYTPLLLLSQTKIHTYFFVSTYKTKKIRYIYVPDSFLHK